MCPICETTNRVMQPLPSQSTLSDWAVVGGLIVILAVFWYQTLEILQD